MEMDEWNFLETFVSTEVDERNALLSHFYSVPNAGTSRLMAQGLYNQLAKKFAHIYAWSVADKRDQINYSQKQPSRVTT